MSVEKNNMNPVKELIDFNALCSLCYVIVIVVINQFTTLKLYAEHLAILGEEQ